MTMGVKMTQGSRKGSTFRPTDQWPLIRALTDPTVVLSPVRDAKGSLVDFSIAMANEAFDGFLGVAVGSSAGRLLRPIQLEGGTEEWFEVYATVLDTGRPYLVDDYPRCTPGSTEIRYFDIRVSRAENAVLVTFRDVSDYVVARRDLEESERRYRRLADTATDLVMRLDRGRVTWASPSSETVLGVTPGALLGERIRERVHTDDTEGVAKAEQKFTSSPRVEFTARFRHHDGSFVWLRVNLVAIETPDGSYREEVLAARDITREKTAQVALAESEALLRGAMTSAAVGMAIHNQDGRILETNTAWRRITRRTNPELAPSTIHELVHPDDWNQFQSAAERALVNPEAAVDFEARFLTDSGEVVWTRVSCVGITKGVPGIPHLLTQITDTTTEHQQRAELEYRALHDPLTGLHNRAWITDMIDSLLDARTAASGMAVLFVGLDNFKVINDSLGHSVGDDVLCAVARRLRAALRSGDRAARLGGDEFVVVATNVGTTREAEILATRICDTVGQAMHLDGHSLVPSASVGVALAQSGSTSASLLRDADIALSRAKEDGRGWWRLFHDGLRKAAIARLNTEEDIRSALAEGQFVPYFQPIVSMSDFTIRGYEALVRWVHPVRGVIPPAEFLPVAEETELVIPMGAQILEQVCALIVDSPRLSGTISVNKSPQQINRDDWRAHFEEVLKRYAVDPRRLIIEVTENAVLTRSDRVLDDLTFVRGLGVGLHIDDFGTGYSSIALLRDLPVTGVKLDRSFTMKLTSSEQAQVLASGISSLAHGLGLQGVAEGIETAEQAQILRHIGWSHGQGFLFGRPTPKAQL